MKILMVITSHSALGETGKKTGLWLEEVVAPYYVFKEAGAKVTFVSPKGGKAPVDPASTVEIARTAATERFEEDTELQKKLEVTKKLADVHESDYDAVFYPGGHGPLWDLAVDLDSIALIESFHRKHKPMAFVCHAPGVLANVEDHDHPLVRNKEVTGFANSEEKAVGLDTVVPFLVEDKLNQLGARYSKGEDWSVFVKRDGNLITGQNPASSEKAARILVEQLQQKENA